MPREIHREEEMSYTSRKKVIELRSNKNGKGRNERNSRWQRRANGVEMLKSTEKTRKRWKEDYVIYGREEQVTRIKKGKEIENKETVKNTKTFIETEMYVQCAFSTSLFNTLII